MTTDLFSLYTKTVVFLAGLLLLIIPLLTNAGNPGVSGTVDVKVLMMPDTVFGYEYVVIEFTSTDDEALLNLSGWEMRDLTGAGVEKLTKLLPAVTLAVGEKYTICQTVSNPALNGPVCDATWGAAAYNNTGDTFRLYDELGQQILEIEVPDPGPDTEYLGSGEISYESLPVASLELKSPSEDGLTFTGLTSIEALYLDDDLVEDNFVWTVETGDCSEDGDVMFGSRDHQLESYTFSDSVFIATFDADELSNGVYCVTVDPQEGDGEDLLGKYYFFIEKYEDPLYRLEGYVYDDKNGNGIYEVGNDKSMKDWTVTAVYDDSLLTTVTDKNGYYRFDVGGGNWVVKNILKDSYVETGIIIDDVIIKSVSANIATTSTNCEATLEITDESGVIVKHECSFLVAKKPNSQGGGTKVKPKIKPTIGQVLGVSTTSSDIMPKCGYYLQTYLRPNGNNNSYEVKKLQLFLVARGYLSAVNGIYDDMTRTAVMSLQKDNANLILTPWAQAYGLETLEPTGIVYKTTRAFINNSICAGSEPEPNLFY